MIGEKIQLKTPEQIVKMRRSGVVVAQGLDAMMRACREGITTAEIDQVGREVLAEHGATSNFLNYGQDWGYTPFAGVACVSVNQGVVHGMPSDLRLAEHDLVSIDFGAIIDGWHGDAARSVFVGEPEPRAKMLSEVTREAMWAGIAAMWTGRRVGDISAAIQEQVEKADVPLGIVRDFTGHGIGTSMHMPPDVPNYRGRRGAKLRAGMCLAIEPILTLGSEETVETDDDWTVVTVDGSWAAHWENTVALCEDGLWVLTEPDGGAAELEARGIPLASLALD